jgi:hypothetical protein
LPSADDVKIPVNPRRVPSNDHLDGPVAFRENRTKFENVIHDHDGALTPERARTRSGNGDRQNSMILDDR